MRPHPEHGRVLRAYITGDGERLLSRAHALVEVEGRMLEGLAEDERACLLAALRGCADALEDGNGRTAST